MQHVILFVNILVLGPVKAAFSWTHASSEVGINASGRGFSQGRRVLMMMTTFKLSVNNFRRLR